MYESGNECRNPVEQEFKSSGGQEFRSSGVQEFRSACKCECLVQEFSMQECRSAGVQKYMSAREQYCKNAGAQECRRSEGERIQKVLIETWSVSCNKML